MALDLIEISEQVTKGLAPPDIALDKFAQNGGDMTKTLKESFLFTPKKDGPGLVL